MTTPLVRLVLAALAPAGLEPVVDEDGDVAVTLHGQRLFVRCVPSEPAMLRVFGHWQLEPDLMEPAVGELTRLQAANAVTGAVNLVKAAVEADRLAIMIDLVVLGEPDLRALLPAALDAVLGSARTWHETVAHLQERSGHSVGSRPTDMR